MNTDRPIGMSAGPIPFTSISTYADRVGIDGDDFTYFVCMIRAMDDAVRGTAGRPVSEKPTGRPLSPELFDAVFG
jgi:hypothetical protein